MNSIEKLANYFSKKDSKLARGDVNRALNSDRKDPMVDKIVTQGIEELRSDPLVKFILKPRDILVRRFESPFDEGSYLGAIFVLDFDKSGSGTVKETEEARSNLINNKLSPLLSAYFKQKYSGASWTENPV